MDLSSESSDDDVRDLTGTTLGDFQVNRLLGHGGMGHVYLATQISLNRPVALKVLHPKLLSKPAYLARFEAEGTAVAKLNHPNIVHVYTLGNLDRVRFIAMEYVEGTNLREYINRKGALDLPLALSIMRQAGLAVGAAGEVGLVHRDIKPENILLTRKGRVKVADFGLCRDTGADRMHVTQPGTTLGTPLYMSPEQAQGRALDHRSDLYSLGVTFYHMLTGEPPFRAETAIALALKHVNEQPLGLRVHRPEIPVELERLVLKLMAKSPSQRYQSAAEMLADLAKIRGSMQPAAMSVGEESALSLPRVPDASGSETPRPERSTAQTASPAASMAIGSGLSAMGKAASTLPAISGQLTRPRNLVLIASVFLLAGLLLGWNARPAVLPTDAETAKRPPGLGLEPRWASIPKGNNAAEQYRLAQFRVPPGDLEAAWLAVPGNFPHTSEWVSPAYRQLARLYYRRGDLDRLTELKAELSTWQGAKTADRQLVQILDPAIKLLSRDLDGVSDGMARVALPDDRPRSSSGEPGIFDPGLLEFGVEVLADAVKLASQPGAPMRRLEREKLIGMQHRMLNFLQRVQVSEWAGR
ncbi:MAG: protein kinase domain-containing protein [Isosphaeraceae bacterium]